MTTLSQARIIIDSALSYARERSMPPMTVAVLDAGGALIAFSREDRSSLLREKIARGKAMGALNLGMGSRSIAKMAETRPHFVASLLAMSDGGMVPGPGGVLVRDADGLIIGAVGVSGSTPDDDEACALDGIEAAGLAPDPGA